MLSKVTATLSLALACGAILFSFFIVTDDPNTTTLDSDIANVRHEIKNAEDESAKYSSGLIKVYIDLRLETYHLAEAMLSTKRASILRRINLVYTVKNETANPKPDLSEIEADITAQQRKVDAAALKAIQYSGGLVQALALSSLETERLSLAFLQLALYGQKYGIPIPSKSFSKADEAKPQSPGNVVSDKDAL
ncbi:MAG TPA: hypothetical protein VHD59_02395 [Pseudolabrys sp.]|jgi:hypothetical protein|nr:hypothetical protein [Pseudolabrys sp.]